MSNIFTRFYIFQGIEFEESYLSEDSLLWAFWSTGVHLGRTEDTEILKPEAENKHHILSNFIILFIDVVLPGVKRYILNLSDFCFIDQQTTVVRGLD